MDTLNLGPLRVNGGRAAEWARSLADDVRNRHGRCVAFANTHLLYCALKERALADALDEFLVLNDGVGIEMLARAVAKRGFEDNLNGTDFTPLLLDALPGGSRVFLVGGADEVLTKVCERWAYAYSHIEFCGAADGYEGLRRADLNDEIAEAKPNVVLAALGNPLQEYWIRKSRGAAPQALWLGVGALFDMVADRHPRAPSMVRQLRLEWLHRLAREPGRLWKRYTYEVFMIAVLLAQYERRSRTMH
jgi:beta-1,4-glucosyltransferase